MTANRPPVPPRHDRAASKSVYRKVATNIIVLVISVGVALAATEVVVRLWTGNTLYSEFVIRQGPLLALPNQTTRFRNSEWDVVTTINERGYNDRPIGDLKAPRWIVSLGDSFAMGYNVAQEDTYAKQLEAILRSTGADINVVNAGFVGSNPKIYQRVYAEHFEADSRVTDAIIGFFIGNDIVAPTTPDSFEERIKRLQGDRAPLAYRLKVLLGENSALYGFVNRTVKSNFSLWKFGKTIGLVGGLPFYPPIYAPDEAMIETPTAQSIFSRT